MSDRAAPVWRSLMHTGTIHPPTSHAAHAGPPAGDPAENIQALRRHVADTADLAAENERLRLEIERLRSSEIVLRNALHQRDELTAELGLRAVRGDEALADLAEHAHRVQRENDRLSAENRALREQTPRPRRRHARRGRP